MDGAHQRREDAKKVGYENSNLVATLYQKFINQRFP